MESDKIILNTIDWDNEDIDNKFTINSYGVDEDGNSIGLKIKGFQPEFYIKLDKISMKFINKKKSNFNIFKSNLEILSKKNLNCKLDNDKSEYDLLSDIKNYDPLDINEESDDNIDEEGNTKYKCHCLKCSPIDLFELNEEETEYYETNFYWKKQGDFINLKDTCIIKRQDLYDGFKWDEENNTSLYFYKFIKIVFNSFRAFNTLKKNLNNTIFYKPLEKRIENKFVLINGIQICCKEVNIDFYESNLAPLLKFFHTTNIKPCGWISIDTIHLKNLKIKYYNCPISYEVNWNNIESIDKLGFAHLNILSWDIEADSEHGDFPQPSKQYTKQGSEIADYYLLKNKQKIKIDENDILNILKKMFSYNIEELDNEVINDLEYINIIHFKNSFNIKNKSKITKIYKKIFGICEKFKKEDNSVANTKGLFSEYNKTSIKYDVEEDYNEYREENIKTNRDKIVFHINKLLIKTFKEYVRGDRLTQIGAVFQRFGSNKLHNKFIITLGSCDKFSENSVIIDTSGKSYKDIIIDTFNYNENYIKIIPFYFREEYDNDNNEELDILETSVILTYKELILQYNPDIIVAYNNFGFDNPFIMKRCEELGILEEFSKISRIKEHEAKLVIKDLSSAALGENILKLIDTKGRIHIDLLKVVQRDYNFESYKLDFIAEHFLQDNKDDISVAELFEFQKLSGEHRARIAKYCVQDCDLLLRLLDKLSVCTNNIGMANVCFVPLTYIFLRGQGIKIQSLVNKFCAEKGVLLKTLYNDPDNNDSYEGAVVLKPYAGIYLESPISVLDYASLYPHAMIGNNISHDSKVESVMTKYKSLEEIENLDFTNMRIPIIFENLEEYLSEKYDKKNVKKFMNEIPIRYQLYPLYDSIYIHEIDIRYIRFKNIYKVYDELRDNPKNNKNLNIKNFHYTTIYFDTYKDKGVDKHKTGIKQVIYASHDNGSKGILPQILQILLSQRKLVRKQKANEKDPFKQNILEGYQLAFKQCANSLYGQTGSKTSVISDLDLASSTTSIGRQMLSLGKSFAEQYYQCKIVYGDTDSVFVEFSSKILNNVSEKMSLIEMLNNNLDKPIDINSDNKLSKEIKSLIESMNKTEGLYKLKISILRSVILSAEIASLLRPPHDLEYEKTFYPFILFTKKRYIGMLYELDIAKVIMKYMGIVLKRRDNANIVKIIYQCVIDIIMNERNIEKSIEILQECLDNLLNKKYRIEDLTITKTLKSTYKNRSSIAHAVLGDRIAKRTGEKVQSNTRIPYIFIEVPDKKGITILQGNRIETPEYVIENNLKIDYGFYITNQIQKPILQIYDLIMKHPEKIFEDALRKIKNTKNNNVSITKWFNPINKNVSLKTKYIIEKGCIYQIQKSKSVIKKCNQNCIDNTNYCEKHINL